MPDRLQAVTGPFLDALAATLGPDAVSRDAATLDAYSVDALQQRVRAPDVVVRPASTAQVAAVARLCHDHRVALVPRGTGTGYTGGAVPIHGGVLLSLERLNRILDIDVPNLLAVVEPFVVTETLQQAVEAMGLFYPPDPASLAQSSLGGNVAECAGGPRGFKYGTTKRYVLGLEAVLPTGEVISTGGRTVKNVVGYDLTSLLVGSEGTLAIITRIVLRLLPKPPATATLRVTFASVEAAAQAVTAIIDRRVEPASLELVDRLSLEAAQRMLGRTLAPAGTDALLLIDVDGFDSSLVEQAERVEAACRATAPCEVIHAASEAERRALWEVRRALSPALRTLAPLKLNHDVVVPKGRIPQLMKAVDGLRLAFDLRIACFGHAGDGNIHVNIMVDPSDGDEVERAHRAERRLFEVVVQMGGAISGEHGIGFTKKAFVPLQLSADEIALMWRIKHAFDPHGILNPGKLLPE
jgi:glycolate oxidase